MLTFSEQARGRVGAFAVGKKPKEVQGRLVERQRLILDCRRTNLMFRAPPVTELGSLPALGDLQIPSGENLYISGGDIRDCFYACRLPESLREYFCFQEDICLKDALEYFQSVCPRTSPDYLKIFGFVQALMSCPWGSHGGFTWSKDTDAATFFPTLGGGGGGGWCWGHCEAFT